MSLIRKGGGLKEKKDLTKEILETRILGDKARESCISALCVLCDSVKSTLGPKGMYKMMAEEGRPFDLTRDGSSVITGLIVKHPAARLIVEMAKAMDDNVGDGTTSTIILAGELVKNAERLMDDGLHPITISNGYEIAAKHARDIAEGLASPADHEKVAKTALKGYGNDRLVSEIIRSVELLDGDLSHMRLEAVESGEFDDTRLIEGSILHNWVVPGSPKKREDARILILRNPMKVERASYLSSINMQAQQLESHFEKEEEIIRKMMERVKSLRANVLVCMQDIDIRAKGMLFSDGILLVEKIMKYPDVEHLCLATGARLVTNIWDASEDDLGEARLVEGREIAEEEIIFFEGCKGDACTFLIRGGTPKIVNEHKRIIYSAVHSVASSFSTPFVLPGGGWMEIEIAKRLRKFANRLGTKEQLAVTSFADSLEIIPKTLAKNSGLDPIDAVLEMGVNCQGVCIDEETRIGDTMEIGIVDPLDIKEQVFSGATEIAELVLLTDGILTDKKKKRR